MATSPVHCFSIFSVLILAASVALPDWLFRTSLISRSKPATHLAIKNQPINFPKFALFT